jgi:Putative sensor
MPSVDAVRNNIRRLGIDTGYVLLALPLAIAGFVVVVTGLSAGLGLLITVIGVPVLAATLFAARLFADIERLRIPAVLNRPRVRPTYRVAEPDAGVWKRMIAPITQIQYLLDAAHAVLQFPIAVTTFSVVVSWWSVAIAGTLTIAWDWSIPRGPDNTSLAQLIGLGDSTLARIGLQTALGLLCLVSRYLRRGGRATSTGARYPRRAAAAAGAACDGPGPRTATAGQ